MDYSWQESFQHLGEAITRLGEVIEMPKDKHRVVLDATIQRFEFTIELFWKTLRRVLSTEGVVTRTPRETLQKAYQMNWIHDEQLWLRMIEDRNETSHIYDEEKANAICDRIRTYHPALKAAYQFLQTRLREV